MYMSRVRIVVVTLITCSVLPFAWIWVHGKAEQFRELQELSSVLRSLRAKDSANQRVLNRIDRDSERGVNRHFPWLPQNNTLPNFYLSSSKDRTPYLRDATIVLVHEPLNFIGGAVSSCFRSLASGHGLSVAPALTFANRRALDSGNVTGSVFKFKNRFRLFHGLYTFGVCDKLDVPCSYVPVFRDPFTSARASYSFCRENPQDDLCGEVRASKVTLRDWIIHQGSPVFRHLITSLGNCRNYTDNVTSPELDPSLRAELLCREFHRSLAEDHGELVMASAVNFIVKNFHRWFSVIGLAEDLDATLSMFQHLYKLPLSKCLVDVEESSTQTDSQQFVLDNAGHSDSTLRRGDDDWFDEDDPRSIVDDYYVTRALDPDVRIYKEAKRLFHIQRQMLTNRVGG